MYSHVMVRVEFCTTTGFVAMSGMRRLMMRGRDEQTVPVKPLRQLHVPTWALYVTPSPAITGARMHSPDE
jgi:hypothetical protein